MPQGQLGKQTTDRQNDAGASALIALGSNQSSTAGGPIATLDAALALLKSLGAVIRAVSPYYHTSAFPAGSGPDFVNAVAEIDVPWSAQETLDQLHRVEAELGRIRKKRWGQRTLDLDLLVMGQKVLPDPATFDRWFTLSPEAQQREAPDRLILPHPRMHQRAFVLVPLARIAPDWRHPVTGRTVSDLLKDLPEADRRDVREVQ